MSEQPEVDFKGDMMALVDMLDQQDAIRDAISETKKEIKATHDIDVKTINQIATILKNRDLDEKDEAWSNIKKLVQECQE